MASRVIVVGAGLAGLATAAALAPRGLAVTLLEARQRLGGRASSFTDAASGQLVDVCQHVSMGCCTQFAHFCQALGLAPLLQTQRRLWFMTPDGRVSRFEADTLPAPLHLARAFLGLHTLSLAEKLRLARGLWQLQRLPAECDEPLVPWLRRAAQTPRTIRRFWGLVLVSALNADPDQTGLRYARKVFVDAFLHDRHGFELAVPRVPLGQLYGEELDAWLRQHSVSVQIGQAVRRFRLGAVGIEAVELRDGSTISGDWYVSAVPFDRLLSLLPDSAVDTEPVFANLRRLDTEPITSVHLWFDRPVTHLPHAVLVDCLGQWLFNRGEVAPGEHYLQIVISAAGKLRSLGHEEIQRRVVAEVRTLFPRAVAAKLRGRTVTEQAATFRPVPGVDRWRPGQTSPIPNLFLAGDWTATGWPATMEGAVRSGYLAAEALLARLGHPERLVVDGPRTG
jgi:squalene-associated FAD-dependent desaturase